MRVLVTRPTQDSGRLTDLLIKRGHEVTAAPLLDITYIKGPALDLNGVQAVLFTSANGVRAFVARSKELQIAALCVGGATELEAANAGFTNVQSAGGDVQSLAALVKDTLKPDGGALIHPAGSSVAGDLAGMVEAAGFTYARTVLYTAIKATSLPAAADMALNNQTIDGVLFYSPRTAKSFSALAKSYRLNSVKAYCLSQAVAAEVAGLNWADIRVAGQPTQDELLALL